MSKRLLMCGFVVALLLAACGDSDSDAGGGEAGGGGEAAELNEEEQTALDAVEGLAEPGTPLADLSDDELMCVAREVVDQEDLFQAMVDDADFEELTVDQQIGAIGMFVDCAGESLVQVMVDGMLEDSSLSDEQANCLATEILGDEAILTGFLQAGATGAEPSAEVLGSVLELFGECDVSLSDLG